MSASKNIIGVAWSFPPKFDRNQKTVSTVTGQENIEQSLNVLFGTQLGERILKQQYGCDIASYLFRPITDANESVLHNQITRAITLFEPRIKLDEVLFNTSNAVEGQISITVKWTEETTNTRNNLVFPFYAVEGTLIPIKPGT